MTEQPLRVLGVSGSLRKDSYNTQLLHNAARLVPPNLILTIDNSIGHLPLYNQDLVTDDYPDVVLRWREAVWNADAFLFASPEYNYSVTGALKNAIDWASRRDKKGDRQEPQPFFGKSAALIGAGGRFGGVRSQMHLRQIASSLNLHVVMNPGVYVFLYPQAPFDDDGNLTDETACDLIRQLLAELYAVALRLKNP